MNPPEIALEYQRRLELMVHDMFINDIWEKKHGRKKSIRILSYCLLYKFITIPQLISTGISISRDMKTERKFLDRLCKKGMLSKDSIEVSGKNHIIYSITNQGTNQTVKELTSLFLKYPELNTAGIDELCLKYIRDKAKKYVYKSNNAHAIGIRNLNAYLLSYLTNRNYSYQIEALIDSSGNLYGYGKRVRGDVTRNMYSLESDALLTIPIHEQNINFYIEQDMNTQRPGIIKGKINNYISNILRYDNVPWKHNILFSLMTQTKRMQRKPKNNEYTFISYFYVKVICFIIHILATDNDFYDVPMQDVANELETYIDMAPVSTKFYTSILRFLNKYLEKEPDLLARDFFEMIKEDGRIHDSNAITEMETVKQHYIAYKQRRDNLYHVIKTVRGIDTYMLLGFSVYMCHSREPDRTFPYLLPPILPQKDERLKLLLVYYKFITIDDTGKYMAAERVTQGAVLKNHYSFAKNSFHVFIENISDDLGGYCRANHYLNNLECFCGKGILICLVENDGIETARKLYMGTAYEQLLHGQTAAALPLNVFFITYSDFDKGKGLFEFSKDGIYTEKERN